MSSGSVDWRGRAVSAAVLLLLAVGAVLSGRGLRVETDVTDFLPPSADPRLSELVSALPRAAAGRTIVLTLALDDVDRAIAAARTLAARLDGQPGIERARAGAGASFGEAAFDLYFPRRFGFAAERPAEVARMLAPGALRARARRLREELALPTAPLVRSIAERDPWLLFEDRLQAMRAAEGSGPRLRDGAFVTRDGRAAIVFITTTRSPFETAAQRPLLGKLDREIAAIRLRHPGLRVEQAGLHRFVVQAEEETRGDIVRVSVIGGLAVLIFLFVLFRSVRLVLAAHVPLVAGMLASTIAARLVFGSIHGIALAFAATLVGVGVDYSAHYLSHHVLAPDPRGPRATARKLAPALLLGAATTAVGLSALAWTALPVLRQVAVLTVAGVGAAVLSTLTLLPPWLKDAPEASAAHRALAERVGALFDRMHASRRLWWVGLPLVVAGLAGVATVRFQDDISALNPADPAMMAEDQRVRGRVAAMETGRTVVVFGDDEEQALVRNDRVAAVLERARADHLISSYRSLHAFLWSARSQRQSAAAVRAVADAWPRTAAAYEAEGFVPDAFAPLRDDLAARASPLRLADLLGSPLAEAVEPHVVRLDRGVALLSFVSGVSDAGALAARLRRVDGAVLFDRTDTMRDAYRGLRTRIIELGAAGLVGVFLLLLARYRRLRPALAAMAPAFAGAVVSAGLLSLAGEELHLLHIAALLLVLSIGADYGVFVVEGRLHAADAPTTAGGLVLACVTTVLSFGALVPSGHPALQAIGLTTSVGVLLSLLATPLTSRLLGPPPR